jgi:tetratricopeptide (TPR) repeat protein
MISPRWPERRGGIRLGLVAFVFLLGLVAGQFTYRYLTRSNRLNDEAVELMNQGKYEAALARLEQALEIDPHHFLANYHRALCLVERRRWDEALDSFDLAIRLQPENARPHFNRGKLLWTLGRFEEGLSSLTRAADLDHEDPETWLLIGECRYELFLRQVAERPAEPRSPAEAVAAFKNYLRLREKAKDRTTVERKLEILQHVERFPEVLQKRQERAPAEAGR